MYRQALIFGLMIGLIACKNDDKGREEKESENTAQAWAGKFKEITPPYQLSDTGFMKNKDTASLPPDAFSFLVPDSIRNSYFGKNARIKYTPLVMVAQNDATYYLIKTSAGDKKAAFVAVFDKENHFGASYPFLLPDDDPTTSQISVLDKELTITKSITQRESVDVINEGKEVVAYDPAERKFGLIMLDALNDKPSVVTSPIDTFPRTHKLAGDYWRNKNNLISVRDGRYPNQLLIYIHTANQAGDCTGELRGEFLLTSSTTATYRQGGDPCVLNLTFKGNTVSMSEESGCGNHRGLDCPLEGTFTKKKPASVKPSSKRSND